MNTSYVQIRNELASEQLIKVQFQVAMSGRYSQYAVKEEHVYWHQVQGEMHSSRKKFC